MLKIRKTWRKASFLKIEYEYSKKNSFLLTLLRIFVFYTCIYYYFKIQLLDSFVYKYSEEQMKNMQNWFENKNNMHLQEKQILSFLYLSNRSLFYLSSKNIETCSTKSIINNKRRKGTFSLAAILHESLEYPEERIVPEKILIIRGRMDAKNPCV